MSAPTYLDAIELGPTQPDSTVIWLHGLGADGHDFEPVVPLLRLPKTRFVLPHAPMRPVTINGGFVMRAWYDILGLDFTGVRESERDVVASSREIAALIERERQRGIANQRIILVGFSQGGAMSLQVGLREQQPLGGIAALSAYLLFGGKTLATERSEANRATPVLCCHGSEDPIVPVWLGKAAYEQIRALDPERPIAWHEYRMGHSVCPEELAEIARWLHAILD
jgi:phospholipase/carboxylesterase